MILLTEIPEADRRPTVDTLIKTFVSTGCPAAEIETADIKVKPSTILTSVYILAKKHGYPVKPRVKTINSKRHYYLYRTDMEAGK